MKTGLRSLVPVIFLIVFFGCSSPKSPTKDAAPPQLTVGVSFEILQTEYWVASFEAFRDELKRRNIRMLDAIADGDANRQLEQINNFITRKVDGIIAVPKDAKTVISMIKAANQASIPIVLYNRPAASTDARYAAVAADNYAIARATVAYMCEQAKMAHRKIKVMILLGDLGDANAIGRRDGFNDAIKPYADNLEVVAQVPTEWNQEKALAGVTNALQANPDIGFIFTSSDFLFPSIISALKMSGKYKKIGEEGHVILGGFDGDATAYRMLTEGYLDADGVQDVYFEVTATVQALLDLKSGKEVPQLILDKGFVLHQGNLASDSARMWGSRIKK